MLRKSILICVALLFVSPVSSFADGVVSVIRGTVLVKKADQEWRILREGETLSEGTTIWMSATSSMLLKVDNDVAELSGLDGQDVTIIKISPLELSGTGVVIKPAGASAPPQLLLPSEGSRSIDGSIILSWSSSEKEALYRIQISADPQFDKILLEEKSYNSERKIEGLNEGKFYWKMYAINKDGIESGPSDVRSFLVRRLPEPPYLNPPASTKTSTTFRWKRKNEEERYHLQIAKNNDFSETIVDLRYIEGPRVTLGMLEEGDYYARVSAIDEDGMEGSFSQPQTFYVGPKVPSSNVGPLMIMIGVALMLIGL